MTTKAAPKTRSVSLRLSDEQVDRIDALSEKLSKDGQKVSRNEAAEYAVTRALEVAEKMTPAQLRALLHAQR